MRCGEEICNRILAETLKLCLAKLDLLEQEFADELLKNAESLEKCSRWVQSVPDLAHAALDPIGEAQHWCEQRLRIISEAREAMRELVRDANRELGVTAGFIHEELAEADEAEVERRLLATVALVNACHERITELDRELNEL